MGKVIEELTDLTYLNWSKARNSSGTAGSFLKVQSDFGEKKLRWTSFMIVRKMKEKVNLNFVKE